MQRNQAGLAELGASNRQHAGFKVNIPQLEVLRFAEAQARDTQ
jgi:hypothetical protein